MMESVLQHHAVLLKDKVRMEAYRKAIEATVKKGSVVLDIGCGLGILSFLALKAGAEHVHAIEVEPATLALARLIAKENGLDKKITFHKGLSTKVRIKDKADVLVSELFGNIGLNENCLPVIIDARERLLKKSGAMVPNTVKVFFAPCEYRDWGYTIGALNNVYGFNMLPDEDAVDLGFPSMVIREDEILAGAQIFKDIDLRKTELTSVGNKMTFEVLRDGKLNGFAGWFETWLSEKVGFSTSPGSLTTHWKQGFLPLRRAEKVLAGQTIKLELEIAPDMGGLNSSVGYHYEIS